MLERASACLDTGVRLSLRAQRRAPKSRRLLHSTFWKHGAGDLELPPCALSPSFPPADHGSHDGNIPFTVAHSNAPTSESSFLDFLYPPQTLAFMARLERTDRRSSALTPASGFRGYSSMSSALREEQVAQEPALSGIGGTKIEKIEDASLEIQAPGSAECMDDRDAEPNSTGRGSSFRPFVEGPASTSVAGDPLEELSHLLQEGSGRAACQRAWAVYSALDLNVRNDLKLRRKLLSWYSMQRNVDVAQDYALRLFERMDKTERDPSAYHSMIAAYLNNPMVDKSSVHKALTLHDEASKQFQKSGSIGSNLLMKCAVERCNWGLAIAVSDTFKRYRERQGDSLSKGLSELFDGIAQVNDLASKVKSLLDLCEARAGKVYLVGRLQGVLETLFGEFVSRICTPKPPRELTTSHHEFRQLVQRMDGMGCLNASMYEVCLIRMTATGSTSLRGHLTGLIWFVYRLYRKAPNSRPSIPLLHRLLLFWKNHRIMVTGNDGTRRAFDVHTIVKDWRTHYGYVDDGGLFVLMEAYARLGQVSEVSEYAAAYKALHPDGLEDASKLWPLIYVHAMRRDSEAARNQFDKLGTEYKTEPDLRCWNVLLYAYERADDIDGALDALTRLTESGMKPDKYSYGPIISMYGKQGDIDSVNGVLALAKENGIQHSTLMLNGLITAHLNADDIDGAKAALDNAVELVQKGKSSGSLSICFNSIMNGYALRRDSVMTMSIYRHMRETQVTLDGRSYGALLLALCTHRQTNSAYRILTTIMPAKNIRATSLHYAVVMAGYTNQGMYDEAIQTHIHMEENAVRPSASTRMAYLKAKAMKESEDRRASTDSDGISAATLQGTIDELLKILDMTEAVPVSGDPEPGIQNDMSQSTATSYFEFLIFIHGQRHCFLAVQQLFLAYTEKVAPQDGQDNAPPIRLLTALMSAHLRAGEYSEVDKYWHLVKTQADQTRQIASPERRPEPSTAPLLDSPFYDPTQAGAVSLSDESTLPSPPRIRSAKPSPALRFTLSRPLRYYMASLSSRAPAAIATMTATVASLLSSSYSLDNRTWNAYIVHLCRASPPRTLLAYTLVERFLMPSWPGWTHTRTILTNMRARPSTAARAEGLEYIQTRYLRPGQLVPQYRTMVYLAHALLALRQQETVGGRPGGERRVRRKKRGQVEGLDLQVDNIDAQMGTLKKVRKTAPRTLDAVQDMPTVFDRLQRKLIRGDE